jgi:hypothetical protein
MIHENTCGMFMNDVTEGEYKINPNFQIEKQPKPPKNEEKTMKRNIRKSHVQKTMWKSDGRNSLH